MRQRRDESAAPAPDASPLDVVLREPNLARRRWALAAGAAVVVAAVVALNSLFRPPVPRGAPDSWDVQVRADGDVAVTIRGVDELAALEATLRSEGYRVTVIAVPLAGIPPSCPPGASLGNPGLIYSVLPPRREPAGPLVLEIDPPSRGATQSSSTCWPRPAPAARSRSSRARCCRPAASASAGASARRRPGRAG